MNEVFELPINRDRVARYFFWTRGWFLSLGLGRRLARRQADSLSYRIEGDWLRVDGGVWWPQQRAIPLHSIVHLDVIQSPLVRRFGLKLLRVFTPGQQDNSWPAATLYGLVDPEGVRDQLLDLIDVVSVDELPDAP